VEIKKLFEEFDEETIRSFVQKNADYYITKWKVMAQSGSKLSWNWAAFLFPLVWLAYRKMHLYAVIYFLLLLGFSVAPKYLRTFMWLGLWIGIGMLGNYLYGRYTYKKLLELKIKFTDEDVFKTQVAKAGGTSVLGLFISALTLFIIYLLGLFLFIAIIGIGLALK